jgi:ABC-2 type transport system ATP-binding protein
MTLSIRNLIKTYGDTKAVNNISIELPKGEVLGLLGRNGAGKTTTIKMILGLLRPDSGSILWDGQTVDRNNLSIGYLPEERGLYPKTKISEQLRYFGQLEGMTAKEANNSIDYWLERFQIPEYKNKLAGELSKGNQQKIQLIGTLLHNPELIILDEPFSGLDPVNASMLSDVIGEQIAAKKTVILSSHRMEQIETFCENVCMMKNGKFVVAGKLQQVKENYGYKNFSFTTDSFIQHTLSTFEYEFEQHGDTYTAKVKNDRQALSVLNELMREGICIRNFSMLEPSLHQIFIERVK